MKISVIAEGSTKRDMVFRRWGLSLLIGKNLLFDTFAKESILLRNMKRMDISIFRINNIVISHEHWDHINGLWQLLITNPGINVYICPGFSQKFKNRLRSFKAHFIEVQKSTKISEDIYVTGEIPGKYMGRYMPEQALVLESMNGLSVITGCAHPGIIKILEEVKKNFDKPIYSVIGGFHLMNKEEGDITSIIKKFREMNIEKVAPMHCTGEKATKLFRQEYGNDFIKTEALKAVEV